MKPPDYIANFDSASAMLRATATSLDGRDFPLLGMLPRKMMIPAKMYGTVVNHLPRHLREQVYIWSGWGEAISTRKAGEIDIERIDEWMVSEYRDDCKYPVIAIGSSNGALVHMYRAMQIPWLPQTVLIPIRRGKVHPDEPTEDIDKCRQAADDMLEANPDVVLHQMHDPNQDRQCAHGEQGQLPVEDKHDEQDAAEAEQVGYADDQDVQELMQLIDVVLGPRHH
jgi:hypothetical protein